MPKVTVENQRSGPIGLHATPEDLSLFTHSATLDRCRGASAAGDEAD
jgi:hypothetical protein